MAAGISIFTLMGSILVDSDKANESIKKTEKEAESLGSKLGGGIKTAAKWGAALGAAAGAGGAALFGMAKKSADATDRIDKLSQKIGISRKGFQEYEYILSQNGTSVEVLQKGFKTLNDRMDESIKGTGKGAEAFKTLDLSATDLNGNLKTQEQMFEESAKALMNMPAGAEKSALAFDLFGKAGQELMPLLNGSAEGMDELRKAANDMGLVLSDESVAAGAKFTDTMDNVKRSLGAAATNIGVTIMPAIQTFLDWVLAHMPEIQEIMRIVFEKIGQFVKIAVDIFQNYLMPAFQFVYEWVRENWPAIQKIIEVVIDTIVDIVKAFVDLFKAIWDKWGEDITRIAESIWNNIKIVIDIAINLIQGIIKTITSLIKGDWEGAWNGIKDIFKNIWDGIAQLLPGLIDTLFNLMKSSFKTFTDIGRNMFSAVWDGMKGIWSSISDWVGEKVSWLTDKLTFWKKSNDEMSKGSSNTSQYGGVSSYVNGSFATGLAKVPFDGFVAELHKGEEILRADDPRNQNNNKNSGINQTVNIYSPTALSPSETARQLKNASRELAMGV